MLQKQSSDPSRTPAAANSKALRHRSHLDKKKNPPARKAKAAQSSMAKEEAQRSNTNSTAIKEKPNQQIGRATFAGERKLGVEGEEWSVGDSFLGEGEGDGE